MKWKEKYFSKKQNILSKKKLSKESLQLKHLAILAIFYGAKSTISGLFYKEFWRGLLFDLVGFY